jgi:hypothetical protein
MKPEYAKRVSDIGEACVRAIDLRYAGSNIPLIRMRNHIGPLHDTFDRFSFARIDELILWDEGMAEYAQHGFRSVFLKDAIKKCDIALMKLYLGKHDLCGEDTVSYTARYLEKRTELRSKRLGKRTYCPIPLYYSKN